ncbi:MAG: hypothetical protein IKO07_13770 [Clostridia bacterium]|nr:hypothetical protein [Clostridia bacterium]
MTLESLCQSAARCADRSEEFVKTADGNGKLVYQGEAAILFRLFRDAINEAYAEIARTGLMPGRFLPVVLPEDGVIRLNEAVPNAAALEGVWDEKRERAYGFRFISRFDVRVPEARPGETLILHVHCIPARLTEPDDEPVFSEAAADPMIYVSLAVARLWQAERRLPAAQSWLSAYYTLLRGVRSSGGHAAKRRFPRPFFR